MRQALTNRVVRRFALVEVLMQTQFWFPVWFLFLRDLGFGITLVVLADAMFRLVVVVCEVPLGVFADRVGRRTAYLLLTGLTVVTYVAIAQVQTTAGLLVVWVVWGVQWAFTSGLGQAYLVDAVRIAAPEVEGLSAFGLVRIAAGLTGTVTLALAGPLYAWSPQAPFLVTAACAALALPLVATLPHIPLPPRDDRAGRLPSFVEVGTVMRDASLRPALVLAGLVLFFGWTATFLFQPLVLDRGMSERAASWMYAGFAAAGMAAGLAAPLLARRWGLHVVTVGVGVMTAACVGAGLAPGVLSIACVPVLGIGYYLSLTTTEFAVADRAEALVRATALSVVSSVAGLAIAAGRPALGLASEAWGAGAAFFAWGVLGVAILALTAVLVRSDRSGAGAAT